MAIPAFAAAGKARGPAFCAKLVSSHVKPLSHNTTGIFCFSSLASAAATMLVAANRAGTKRPKVIDMPVDDDGCEIR